jgi:hypothetical protein
MLKLKKFDETDYERYPRVENLRGEIVPMLARVQMRMPGNEGWYAKVVVDGDGIHVMVYDEDGEHQMVFSRELTPFPLAVFVGENLEEPLDPQALTKLGFVRFH